MQMLCSHTIDYGFLVTLLGVLVGILSILVMVLIGWQIYQAIGFQTKINDVTYKQINYDGLLQLTTSYIHEWNGDILTQ